MLVIVLAAALVVVLGGGAAGYLLLRTTGSPQQTAASYLRDWQRSDYRGMDKVSVNVPAGGLARPLRQAAAQLGLRGLAARLGQVSTAGGAAQAPFTVSARLASGHTWTYRGRLQLVDRNRRWWVSWSPAAIYPGLRAGQRFVLSATWPARAAVLAAGGTQLSSPAVIAQSGSLALLTGTVVRATKAQAKALGAPYQAGDLVGDGGIEQAYQPQLAGRPSLTIQIAGPGQRTGATAARFAAVPASRCRPASTCRIRWPRRPPCRPRQPASRSTWWSSSHPPARCWPWWSGRAGSTARWPGSSRPARRSRWSPRRPWPSGA